MSMNENLLKKCNTFMVLVCYFDMCNIYRDKFVTNNIHFNKPAYTIVVSKLRL